MLVSRPEAVLIVDDDDRFVRNLSRELRGLGFPFVYRASSAQQALAMLHRVHPTLVLLGFEAPPSSNQDVILRAQELGASVATLRAEREAAAMHPEVPQRDKRNLTGQALESFVSELIGAAQRRSRSSIPVAERVA